MRVHHLRNAARDAPSPLRDLGQREGVMQLEDGSKQFVLAAEVIIERAFGDARPRGDRIDADARIAVPMNSA